MWRHVTNVFTSYRGIRLALQPFHSALLPTPCLCLCMLSMLQVAVLGITAGAALYWWYVVVPTARGRLAIDKRKGETAEYLSELETEGAVEERRAERWLYAEWLQKRADLAAKKAALPAESVSIATASGEAAIASSTSSSKPNMSPRKVNTNLLEPEIRTPMPNFFSFDNPIVATLGALAGISICTSIISMLFTE